MEPRRSPLFARPAKGNRGPSALAALACALLLGSAALSQAGVLVSEDFSYGDSGLDGQNGGTGFSSAWSSATNVTGGVATGNDPSTRSLATPFPSSGILWVSFDWGNVSKPAENASFGGLTFFMGGSEKHLIGNPWPGTGHDKWMMNEAGATTELNFPGMKTAVAKITLGAGATSTVELWVGPVGSPVDVSGPPLATATGREFAGVDRIRINGQDFGGGGNNQSFDNLLIGETAADVDATDSPSTSTSGTWTNTAGGTWSTAGNWLDGVAATGIGSMADFNTIDIATDTTVELDSARTVCNLGFGDTDMATVAGWTLTGNSLNLAGPAPTITVHGLAGTKAVTIGTVLAGSSGLTKSGPGTLILSAANTYTGITTINHGTLRMQGGAFLTAARSYTIATGADLDLEGNTGIASGTTTLGGNGTVRISGGTFANASGSGHDVIMEMASGAKIDITVGAAMQNGGWQNINWSGNLADMLVDGTFDIWDGNQVKIDALSGSGTIDKNHPGNSPVSLTVGVDNGSGIFTGTIANALGLLSLVKSGGGTQTLAGTTAYSGNTLIQAGTLRLGNGTSPTNLADTANVIVSPNGMLDLDYTGTDLINALWVDGIRLPPGVYSSSSGFITGTGTLTVATGAASTTYAIWSGRGGYHLTGGPSDDDDQDGLTNFEEFVFGLIPKDGKSCSPISVGFDKSRGSFSYTRRKQSQADNLAFSVWFSEDLVDWTEDTSASEVTVVPSGDIETVEVRLFDLPGIPLPEKLFIQVRARAQGESPLPNGETRSVKLQFQSTSGVETITIPESGDFQVGEAIWNSQTQTVPVPGRPDCEDITLTVKLLDGEAKAASVSYVREFANWDTAGYVMIPSAVYNGNRFDVSFQPWPPLWRDSSQFRVDMPITFTDQPRLTKDGSPGKIELDTGACATPAMGLRAVDGRGFLLLTKQQCEFGNLGYTIEELPAENLLRLVVTAPRSRSRIPGGTSFGAGDPPRDWKAGDTATIRMRAWRFSAPTVQTLFDRFSESRKDLEPSAPVNEVPFSAAWHLVEDKLNTLNWNENLGFYCHGNTNSETRPMYDYWQLGWVSGGINTIANLLQGNALSRARTQRTLDFMFVRTPAPSGFWYGASNGTGFYGDAIFDPHPHNQSMVRKQADGLAYGMKQLLLMREQNLPIPTAWETSARGLADAFIRNWQKYGQLGQFIDIQTGDILVGGSTAGAHAPAGLARAAAYFDEPTYLQFAEEIGRFFLNNDLRRGVTCGGPGEALAAPDSESAFALVESFVDLHQATGKSEWANAARDAVRQCATWVVSYDYQFPANSTLGQSGTRATGAVVANVQNKHGSPGICTLSGDSLFKLWRATGDETALDLVRDIAHGIPQYLSRPDRLLGTIPSGWMCERVNLSDWEGAHNVGGNVTFNAIWCENAMILTAAEIPGVYVNTDTKRVIVFDHVTAQLEGDTLVVHNPTQFAADVKILIENTAATTIPLGVWTLKNAQSLSIPAGGSAELDILPSQP